MRLNHQGLPPQSLQLGPTTSLLHRLLCQRSVLQDTCQLLGNFVRCCWVWCPSKCHCHWSLPWRTASAPSMPSRLPAVVEDFMGREAVETGSELPRQKPHLRGFGWIWQVIQLRMATTVDGVGCSFIRFRVISHCISVFMHLCRCSEMLAASCSTVPCKWRKVYYQTRNDKVSILSCSTIVQTLYCKFYGLENNSMFCVSVLASLETFGETHRDPTTPWSVPPWQVDLWKTMCLLKSRPSAVLMMQCWVLK